jgi:hypothetical protein
MGLGTFGLCPILFRYPQPHCFLVALLPSDPALDPLVDIPGVPYPSVFGRLPKRLLESLPLLQTEQCPVRGSRVSVTTVYQSIRSIGVVTASCWIHSLEYEVISITSVVLLPKLMSQWIW